MADSKLTALSELSVPALEDLAYLVDDPAGTPVSVKASQARVGGLLVPGICEGRLSLSSTLPVTLSDVTAASTIYWHPFRGDRVALYDGTRWKLYAISAAKSLALSSLTSGKNYDVFVYDNSGTLTLELSAAWTTDTTRADALTLQNNVLVKSSATTRRYLGTFRSTSSSTTDDAGRGGAGESQVGGKRFLWNYYARVARHLAVYDSTATWTYTTNAWRQANAVTTNKLEFVVGVVEDTISAHLQAGYQLSGGAYASAGIGLDSITAIVGAAGVCFSSGSPYDTMIAQWNGVVADAGYHYLAWLENGLGSGAGVTFVGPISGVQLSRLMATVYA